MSEPVIPERWRGVDKVLDLGEAMDAHFHNALIELGTAESLVRELVRALQGAINDAKTKGSGWEWDNFIDEAQELLSPYTEGAAKP